MAARSIGLFSEQWARCKYIRSCAIVTDIASQLDMDIMDMVDIAKQNEGDKYVLVVIDIFSRFAHCLPVKSKKKVEDVLQAYTLILSGTPKQNITRMDQGHEFCSKGGNAYLKSQNIQHIYALNTETRTM